MCNIKNKFGVSILFSSIFLVSLTSCGGGSSSSSNGGGGGGGGVSTCAVANRTTGGAIMTVTNNSGRTISFDWIRSVGATTGCAYGQGAAYNFNTGSWDSEFTHASGEVYQLSSGSCVKIPVNTSCIEGGANMYIVGNTASKSFENNMSSIPGQPNEATYPDTYGLVETGWVKNSTAVWDISYVNSFGIPLQMSDGTTNVGIKSGNTRSSVIASLISGFNADPNSILYSDSIFPSGSTGSGIIRVFSPQHYYTSITTNYWGSSINSGLTTLASSGSSFEYGGFTYSNYSYSGGNFSATCANQSTGYQATCTLSNITTANAIAGEITYSPDLSPTDSGTIMAAKFAGMISAVINRGVLANPNLWGTNGYLNTGTAYYQYWYQTSPYNVYAKVLTSYGINNMLYADSYDDFWGMSSSLSIGSSNNQVSLTVLPFN